MSQSQLILSYLHLLSRWCSIGKGGMVYGSGIAGSHDKATKTIIDGTLLKRFQLWTQVSVAVKWQFSSKHS
ncbi:hypothetical protein MTP99_015920 [Tenebrio molitor]|nr:hypothetical protein MTP99_015920 [Tenebrio molitor]